MTDTVLQSFCERCGTRYTFTEPEPKPPTEGSRKGLGRFGRRAPAEPADTDEPTIATAPPSSDHFAGTFHFCLDCRQYVCTQCWSPEAGGCLTCHPPHRAGEPTTGISAQSSPFAAVTESAAWPSDDVAKAAAAASSTMKSAPWGSAPAQTDEHGVELDEWGRPRKPDKKSEASVSEPGTPAVEPELDPWRGVVFSTDDDGGSSEREPAATPAPTTTPFLTDSSPLPEAWPATDQPAKSGEPVADASAWPEVDRPDERELAPKTEPVEPDAVPEPEPEAVVEPEVVAVVEPEVVEVVEPEVEPEAVAKPVAEPEPAAVPEAIAVAEPEPAADAGIAPEPEPVADIAPEPATVAAAAPVTSAATEPETGLTVEPQPATDPAPETVTSAPEDDQALEVLPTPEPTPIGKGGLELSGVTPAPPDLLVETAAATGPVVDVPAEDAVPPTSPIAPDPLAPAPAVVAPIPAAPTPEPNPATPAVQPALPAPPEPLPPSPIAPLTPVAPAPGIEVWATPDTLGPFHQPYQAPVAPAPAPEPSASSIAGPPPAAGSATSPPALVPPTFDTPPAAAPLLGAAGASQQPVAPPVAAPQYDPLSPAPQQPVSVPPIAPAAARATPVPTSGPGTHGCTNCGLPLSAKARFCRRCGAQQD